jgi:hypothetical protein
MSNHIWKILLAIVVVGLGLAAQPAYAHGFGDTYDLPVPLWLYISGAGATVAVSFVVIGYFIRGAPGLRGYPTFDLLQRKTGRRFVLSVLRFLLKVASVAVFTLVVVAGLLGNQKPLENLAPTMVWVIWWVGLAYVSALVGNVWTVLNPWSAVFGWAEALYRQVRPGGRLSLGLDYPERLGTWPGIALFLAFAWVELVYPSAAVPRSLATLMVAYSLVTWAGMAAYGKHQWLRHGEAFSVIFGLLARFAPTEVAVRDAEQCGTCSAESCGSDGECGNCYECFENAEAGSRMLNLRPYAAGLLKAEWASPSLMVFVVLALATVTFDGFTATPFWLSVVNSVYPAFRVLGGQALAGLQTLSLLAFPAIFMGVYLAFSAGMAKASGSTVPAPDLARAFVFSLVPIALAYHLAHYLSFLMIQGQFIIPLASDPMGRGWDLLGTAEYKRNIGIVGARFAWISAVIAIVIGHIVAVYVAHVIALRTFPDERAARRSQYPMVVLMVGYTMLSLWIIAQPVVEISRT